MEPSGPSFCHTGACVMSAGAAPFWTGETGLEYFGRLPVCRLPLALPRGLAPLGELKFGSIVTVPGKDIVDGCPRDLSRSGVPPSECRYGCDDDASGVAGLLSFWRRERT